MTKTTIDKFPPMGNWTKKNPAGPTCHNISEGQLERVQLQGIW